MSELKQQIANQLKELRYDCALKRLFARRAFGQAEAQAQPKDVAEADKMLADFIAEGRPIMGIDWPGSDHGRLCWAPYCGGRPIGQYYCQLEEGHSGRHIGKDEWDANAAWPNSELQEVTNDYEWHKLVAICAHSILDSHYRCEVCGFQKEKP